MIEENELPNKGFKFFEKLILDGENTPHVKYSIDRDIEASVKYDFLIEAHGKKHVDTILSSLDKTMLDLNDPEVFEAVKVKKD